MIKVSDSIQYHVWSDALHASELARQTENEWDRGAYVRWTIQTAWSAFENVCTDTLQASGLGMRFKERFDEVVETVSADDSLGRVVVAAFEKGFSQFPVLSANRFVGLITENEISRWLGRRVKANGSAINLDEAAVKTVLREKDPFRNGIPIFKFVALDTPVVEVMGLFSARPMLESVLLTKSGNRKDKIEGIITRWDAARFPN